MTDLEFAKEIAHRAHDGQARRNGEPYINHVRRVVGTLMSKGASEEVISAAWMHDVIEDRGEDYGIMLELFPKEIAIAVFRLTRYKGFPYDLYIEEVKKNPIATQVKLADLLDNLQDNDNPSQIERYTKALLTLTQ